MVYVTKSPLFTYWDPADFEMVIVPRAVGRGVAVPVITGDAVSVRVTVDVVVNVYVNVGAELFFDFVSKTRRSCVQLPALRLTLS
jgi:hypothetical protein